VGQRISFYLDAPALFYSPKYCRPIAYGDDMYSSVRYPTAGSSHHAEAQPFYVTSPHVITFAHVSLLHVKTFL
jgi:glutamine phosphoribosylpyrophosphate amidotransferase